MPSVSESRFLASTRRRTLSSFRTRGGGVLNRYRPRYIVGMDPGSKGSVAILPSYDLTGITTLDLHKYSLHDIYSHLKDISRYGLDIYLENPGYMPRNSEKSLGFSKLARSVGQLEGICHSLASPPTLVTPPTWQRGIFSRTTKGDKSMTRNHAISLFGQYVKVTHSNAEALLIAHYGSLLYS